MKHITLSLAALATAITLSGCISDIAGKTIVEEFNDAGKITKRTTTSEPIIEQLVASTKDKSCFFFKENFVVGLIASPVSEAAGSVFSIQAIYAHKKIGLATIHEKHQTTQTANIINAMNKMQGVTLAPTGIASTTPSK